MSAADARLGARAVLEDLTPEKKEWLLQNFATVKEGTKSGFAGVIPAGEKWQARMWVAAKGKQIALPATWKEPQEAALWLAYMKWSQLPVPSPKKVKPRGLGELAVRPRC